MSYLDDILGKIIRFGGNNLPQRKILNFVGTGVTAADNPSTGQTDVTINSGSVADSAVTTAKIADAAVTGPKIANGTVSLNKIANSVGLSVVGRSANTTGAPADIVGTDGLLLRVAGSTLGFGQALTAAIADNAVTLAKLATQAALSVLGNATNATAVPSAIVAGTDGHIFRRAGTALGFGKILTSMITGTSTNNNATAGDIGEVVSSTLVNGSATSLVSGTAKTVTSISLTAGDWDVSGNVGYTGTATATTVMVSSISLVNNTRGSADSNEGIAIFSAGLNVMNLPTPTVRISIASTTTIYLVGLANFTGGTFNGYGTIRARRAR